MKHCSLFFICLFIILSFPLRGISQQKNVKVVCVGFYNLENLFDTIKSPVTDDTEFTPAGISQWNTKKYLTKLDHLASVISKIGEEYSKGGPMAMGLSEVENRNVVEDLVHTAPLDKSNYGVVHYDSPDKRGIDVAFIYRTSQLKVIDSRPVHFYLPSEPDFRTRDILVVSGVFDSDTLYFMVNHWPSRSKGEMESAYLRNAAADLCRTTADSIMNVHPGAKIIIMGDLNDDPTNASLMEHLKVQIRPEKVGKKDLYNPMWKLFRDGAGSLAYRDSWNLFDQMIVSGGLMKQNSGGYFYYSSKVFRQPFLLQKEGQYAGYPFRTYAGGVYMGGYSDHLPVYTVLIKELH
ncbi:MAG: endonuclease/exonuclease/phosphatase family protein [Bacteroidota bacterium]|nr:endonuclease/exonuclease/phosphatase family protein [Bacteroidota bacterium]